MTSALEQTQAFFAGAIRSPQPVADQPGVPVRVPALVAGNARLSPADQLEIYREQFWLRHVGALEEDYVSVVYLLGHDGFHALAERYLAAHPPREFSLRELGARLPGFVAEDPTCKSDALVADCARLEWAFVEAFDAPDAAPVEAAAIASVPEDAWPLVRLSLHPSLQLVAMAHPAHEYRAGARAGTAPSRPPPRPTCVAVYRGPETLQYIEVDAPAYRLLRRLEAGDPLGEACEAVAADPDAGDLEARVGGWFQQWAASGWLTGIGR
jgi:hypothetical protein